MKTHPLLLLCLYLVLGLVSSLKPALAGSEGIEMILRISASSGEPGDTVITLKAQNNKLRTDLEGMSTIYDPAKGTVISLMHEDKAWMQMPVPEAITKAHSEPEPFDAADFRPTGNRKNISGWECEEFVSDKEKAAVWLTKDIKLSPSLLGNLQDSGGAHNPLRDFFSKTQRFDGVPIRIESLDKEAPFLMTVESLVKKTMNSKEFEPPANYTRLEIPPEMMEMLQQFSP